MSLKNETICIVDNGLFVDFARMLGREAGRALYYAPSAGAFVKHNRMVVGEGFDELERTAHPFAELKKIDRWIFLDLYHWDWQMMLEEMGVPVWGAREGEKLELYRWEFKQMIRKLGLPVQEMDHIIGLEPLREHLKAVRGSRFIKTSYLRGDMETWEHENYEQSEEELDRLAHRLGFAQHRYEFISEAPIPDAVEIGYDGPCVDGQFPDHAMQAYEIKELGMFGVVKPYAQLAKPVRDVNAKLAPALKGARYRCMFSTEIRYRQGKPYLIDPCCRLGTPSNELLRALFTGWGQSIAAGSEGRMVSPKPAAKYGVLAAIRSTLKGGGGHRAVRYPEELDPWVSLRFHARDGGTNYVVSQPGVDIETMGFVAGSGKTLLAAVQSMAEHAKQINGHEVTVNLASIDQALDTIAKGEKDGVHFSEDPLPTVEELKKAVG